MTPATASLPDAPLHPWSYARISRDDEKQGKGVVFQHGQNEAIAARLGWPVLVERITDNDLSAADPTIIRPGYMKVKEAIRDGRCDGLVIYKQDRGVRLPRDLEDLIDLAAQHRVQIMASTGAIDLHTTDGRLRARILNDVAMSEVERVRDRVRDKMKDNADNGLPPGGPPGYGYDKGYAVNPTEAAVILSVIPRVLGGESIREIVRDLNARNIPAKNGGRWERSALRYVLIAPRIAGLRKHQGKVVGKAMWEAIIPEDTHHALVAFFAANGTWKTPGRYTLTGFLTCGICQDTTMGHHVMTNRTLNQYACKQCRRVGINMRKLEKFIAYSAGQFLDSDEVAGVLASQDGTAGAVGIVREIDSLNAESIELARMKGAGELKMVEWKEMKEGTDKRIASLTDSLATIHSASVLTEWAGKGSLLEAEWDDMTVDAKRRVVEGVFSSITIDKATTRGPRFDPTRVRIVWAV